MPGSHLGSWDNQHRPKPGGGLGLGPNQDEAAQSQLWIKRKVTAGWKEYKKQAEIMGPHWQMSPGRQGKKQGKRGTKERFLRKELVFTVVSLKTFQWPNKVDDRTGWRKLPLQDTMWSRDMHVLLREFHNNGLSEQRLSSGGLALNQPLLACFYKVPSQSHVLQKVKSSIGPFWYKNRVL